jgi:hypothetical protein
LAETRPQNLSIRVGEAEREAIEEAASSRGQTLSRWCADVIRAALPAAIRKRLPPRRSPGRPWPEKQAGKSAMPNRP